MSKNIINNNKFHLVLVIILISTGLSFLIISRPFKVALYNALPPFISYKYSSSTLCLHSRPNPLTKAVKLKGLTGLKEIIASMYNEDEILSLINDTNNCFGAGPFIVALTKDDPELTRYLIKLGLDTKIKYEPNKGCQIPRYLYKSVKQGKLEVTKVLLPKDYDLNKQCTETLNPKKTNKESFKKNFRHSTPYFIDRNFKEQMIYDSRLNLIHLAAQSSNPNLLKYLISKGADITIRDAGLRSTLHFAAISKSKDNLEFLLQEFKNKALSYKVFDSYQRTPLHYSSLLGFKNNSSILSKVGFKLETKDKLNLTSDHYRVFSTTESKKLKELIFEKPEIFNFKKINYAYKLKLNARKKRIKNDIKNFKNPNKLLGLLKIPSYNETVLEVIYKDNCTEEKKSSPQCLLIQDLQLPLHQRSGSVSSNNIFITKDYKMFHKGKRIKKLGDAYTHP